MQQPVDRQFYTIESNGANKSHFHTPSNSEKETLVKNVADSVIGKDKIFSGPFGKRRALYLDYIASGRALTFIEDYIQREVLPEYGNTHTTTSVTSLQTTLFRHEARDIVRNAVNASEHDSVIFTGSGSTGAIHKLIHALDLKEPPVVFVGPYEHHSNLLPWKEAGAQVVRIKQTAEGLVDLSHLEQHLKEWTDSGHQLIGSFSAASNVTGILCDVDAVTVLLHKYGARAFWDYATAAPYVRIDMNPVVPGKDSALLYKDAVFLSPHKFVGGVNTPGVLIAKKKLFQNNVPHDCGGGTVFFVRREAHRHLREPELREEGGTPDILGSIRAGLVFQLKSSITPELIMQKEHDLFKRAAEAWKSVPNLVILGNLEVDRLPIFSFLVYNPASGLFLHHNYVSSLLNDLFGIQARGGCACAGPYAMDLLGLTEEKATVIEELLAEDRRLDRVHLRRYTEYSHREVLRPGFTRLNLPFFLSEEEVDFVLQSVAMVAEHGWKLLPQYMFNPETGEWRHKEQQAFKERKWLGHISYASGRMEYSVPKVNPKGPLPQSLQDCLNAAQRLFGKAEKSRSKTADQTLMFDEEARPYRWFLLPSEANQILSGVHPKVAHSLSSLPFCPHKLLQQLNCTDHVTPAGIESENQKSGALDCNSSISAETSESQRGGGSDCDFNVCATTTELRVTHEKTGCEKDSCSVVQTHDGHQLSQEVTDSDAGRTLDRLNEERPTFQQSLQRVMERGYGDTVSGLSRTDGTVSHEFQEVKAFVPQPERETVRISHPQPEPEKLTKASIDPGESSETVLEHDYAPSQENGTSAVDVTAGQPDSAHQVPIDSSGEGKTISSENGVSPSSSETLQDASSSRSKSKKKKNKVKCVENGACELPKQQTKSSKKEPVLGNHWVSPSKDIFKPTVKALEEFSMISNGDRVLVCLSGGKDSLSLLHTLHQYQFYCRSKGIQFDLGAVTVDPQTPSYDPSPLKKVLADLGVPYFYESQCIMETAVNLPYECASICSFCSRMKRGRIYAAARREGYNVLALGQHLDDLAESFIMSLFHNGSLRTMKAHYTVQEGDLRVIRPFVYVREKDLRTFAEKNCLPVIPENCPACFDAPKERHRTKQLLASQEVLFPRLYSSILSAIKPVMSISRTGCSAATLMSTSDADDLDI